MNYEVLVGMLVLLLIIGSFIYMWMTNLPPAARYGIDENGMPNKPKQKRNKNDQ